MRTTLLLVLFIGCADAQDLPPPRQDLTWSQALEYHCAAENDSSAPSYLWVNASDQERERRWSVVVESTAIEGDAEHDPDLDFQASGTALTPRYTTDTLAAARTHLEHFTDDQIRTELRRKDPGGEGDIRSFIRNEDYWAQQEALAHALFERGFYPSRGDLTPTLYVDPSPCEDAELERAQHIELLKQCTAELQESERER